MQAGENPPESFKSQNRALTIRYLQALLRLLHHNLNGPDVHPNDTIDTDGIPFQQLTTASLDALAKHLGDEAHASKWSKADFRKSV